MVVMTLSCTTAALESYSGSDNKMPMRFINFTMDNVCDKLMIPIGTKLCIKGYPGGVFIQAGICVTQFDSSTSAVAGLCPYYLKHVYQHS